MKLNLKTLSYEILSRIGLSQLQKRLFSNYITIVMYHGVIKTPLAFYDWSFIDEGSFRHQINYLKKHFEVIRLSEIYERMRSGRKDRPAAVITFDDGYQNNYDVAFPILQAENVPASIFLTTGFIDTDHTLWSFRLHHAFSKTSRTRLEFDDTVFDITGPENKVTVLRTIKDKLKELPHPKVVSLVREIVSNLRMDPEEDLDEDSPYRILSRKAIKAMANSGLVEFGAHTNSHAILSRLSAPEQYEEISRSIDAVRSITGVPCTMFAYPNGSTVDYNSETMRILRECGVAASATTISGYNDDKTPMLELRRYGIESDTSLANFRLMVHHVIPFVKSLGWSAGKTTDYDR